MKIAMGQILRWGLLQLCQSLVNGLYLITLKNSWIRQYKHIWNSLIRLRLLGMSLLRGSVDFHGFCSRFPRNLRFISAGFPVKDALKCLNCLNTLVPPFKIIPYTPLKSIWLSPEPYFQNCLGPFPRNDIKPTKIFGWCAK